MCINSTNRCTMYYSNAHVLLQNRVCTFAKLDAAEAVYFFLEVFSPLVGTSISLSCFPFWPIGLSSAAQQTTFLIFISPRFSSISMNADFMKYYTLISISHDCRYHEILPQNYKIQYIMVSNFLKY